jgi:hypothetical protein
MATVTRDQDRAVGDGLSGNEGIQRADGCSRLFEILWTCTPRTWSRRDESLANTWFGVGRKAR